MPNIHRLLTLSLTALIVGAGSLSAVLTDPVGYATLRIAGTGGHVDRAQTYLATPLLGSVVETGTIIGTQEFALDLEIEKSAADQPDSAAAAAPSRESYAGTHYLQIIEGPRTGYHVEIAGGDAAGVRTAQDVSGLLQAGDSYVIRPYSTLGRIFGTRNESGRLQAAERPAAADHVFVPDPESGRLAGYYFHQTASGRIVLTHLDGQPAESDPILYPGSGFMISRIAEKDSFLIDSGAVQPHAAIIPLETGVNFIASVFPTDTSLAAFFGPDGGGLSPQDRIALPGPYGSQSHYRLLRGADAEAPVWLSEDPQSPAASEAIIPAGSVIIVYRQGPPLNLKLERFFEL